jgi:alanine-synthesizing transaminase
VSYRFSRRTGWDVGESAFAAAVREARAAAEAGGRRLLDLTISNPTVCGFEYDTEAILGALGQVGSMVYDPDPRGMRSARQAVALYYEDHGAAVDPDAIVLTTSTSEGYGYLFRLLCDAGDEVLVAQPSYPLLDFLADLEDVTLRPYPLFYDYGWWIDFAELERRIGPRTKAIVVVHPNNPTGHATGSAERLRLEEICLRHGLALIVDEVFLDYPFLEKAELQGPGLQSFAVGPHPVPTFCLSGMSKIAGLPQMKVGWIASFGPAPILREALGRLEVVADTFLSMNAPMQMALPVWLASRGGMQRQIRERALGNLEAARRAGLEVLRTDAGWSAILRLRRKNALGAEKDSATELLREVGVVTHPGTFYGLAENRRLVLSLIGSKADFAEAVARVSEGNG